MLFTSAYLLPEGILSPIGTDMRGDPEAAVKKGIGQGFHQNEFERVNIQILIQILQGADRRIAHLFDGVAVAGYLIADAVDVTMRIHGGMRR